MVLGPLLFCFVVSALKPLTTDAHLVKYVDDTTLCVPLYKNESNDHVINEHLNVLKWSSENGFKINLAKCKTICFTKMRNVTRAIKELDGVSEVDSLRFLGVTISDRLNLKSHIDNVCSLASKRIYGLRVLKKMNLSHKSLCLVYNAVVRSLLEYASPSFGELPSSLSGKLDKVQRRSHRLICGLERGSLCDCGGFVSLSHRRKIATLKLFQKLADPDHILHSILPGRSKHSSRFAQPPASTTRFRSSFIPHATFISNSHI